ncbi:hypothetical protein [Paenibacillus piri]|uniref:DUF1080 domain-containing protein n=1 Tax=Paenibacillus piri TaxID=2547395 RepID=A0A4R5KW01_9BACL|nr:hypothetical protein [Paenibacillus piri]TDG00164.1 hypothetical protein E1757_00505 [Paenibacillus piri]
MTELVWELSEERNDFDLGDSGACPGIWRDRKALYFDKNERAVPALLRDELAPGFDCFRLEAEIACPGPYGFVGLAFGARDAGNYELVYVSPGIDGGLGEIQYDPIMNGSSTWQIYNGPRYQAPAPFRPGEWTRLALEIQPDRVAIRVGEAAEPQLVISSLQHGRAAGRIGVWGYLPGYVRNLRAEAMQPAASARSEAADLKRLAADGFVTEWSVSKPYPLGEWPEPEDRWVRASVEENGTLNVNRLHASARDISVQACCAFQLPEAQETRLTFGFSDALRLWVNGEEVYRGEWGWGPPDSDGRIRPDFAGVPVLWRAGENTSRAEITSREVMFGWGLSMRSGLAFVGE